MSLNPVIGRIENFEGSMVERTARAVRKSLAIMYAKVRWRPMYLENRCGHSNMVGIHPGQAV